MIIWGRVGREIEQERGEFLCPRCNSMEEYRKVRVATYFTLYFIPLFETRHHGDYVECYECRRQFDANVLNDRTSPDPQSDQEQNLDNQKSAKQEAQRIEDAKRLVSTPAIFLVVTGILGLFGNLSVGGYAFIDEFITPLRTKQKNKAPEVRDEQDNNERPANDQFDSQGTIRALVTTCSLALASGLAVWAGFSMLSLRRYWLTILGSLAVMPGTCFCCFAGVPIGIWSIVVLLNPKVRSSFH